MSQLVQPFSGRVVDPAWAARVVSPLFDVLTEAEQRAVLATEPDSYLHVSMTDSAAAQQRLLDLGAYRPAQTGAVFAYRMGRGERVHTGLVAQVDLAGFADGRVLGHEAVQPERVARLVRHLDAVPRRSELVSLVHRDDAGLAEQTARTCAADPLVALTDVSGVEQAVWPAAPEESAGLAARLTGQRLYIADGHHRVAAALARWRRDGRPEGASVLCVLYPERQVRLYAFHRRVAGPVPAGDLAARLAGSFHVEASAGPTQVRGWLGLYAGGQWSRLSRRTPSALPGRAGLDVTWLDEQVLEPVLGVRRGDPRLEFVPELRDLADSVAACDRDGGVLFTVLAPDLDDLVAVAERGEVMSAKSTYVEPKPRTGIFLTA